MRPAQPTSGKRAWRCPGPSASRRLSTPPPSGRLAMRCHWGGRTTVREFRSRSEAGLRENTPQANGAKAKAGPHSPSLRRIRLSQLMPFRKASVDARFECRRYCATFVPTDDAEDANRRNRRPNGRDDGNRRALPQVMDKLWILLFRQSVIGVPSPLTVPQIWQVAIEPSYAGLFPTASRPRRHARLCHGNTGHTVRHKADVSRINPWSLRHQATVRVLYSS